MLRCGIFCVFYNKEIFNDIENDIDVLFLPVNGVGNNMNCVDAQRFAKKVGAKKVVPIHVGMFDELSPEIFNADNRLILQIYKQMEI